MSLKSAVVTPILKKPHLHLESLKNYRPISTLPLLSKLVEKIVAGRIRSHMHPHGLPEPLQSAYWEGCSTETALLCMHDHVLRSLESAVGVILLLLDLSIMLIMSCSWKLWKGMLVLVVSALTG